ncbi:MAG: carbon-nitrogen hydrolase family protein [Chloroflexi bacterium]|nr:MAG: carbon-nitrogen hydrolase family protein [Chloroflexota bacterium]MBA4374723.1 carbon-nitrogen hydrolase [Anaerolinea sp.]
MKKIALGQMNIEYGNFSKNTHLANEFILTSIIEHCDLILLPELWSSGFDLKNAEKYAALNEKLLDQMQSLSNSGNITICGSYIREDSGKYYNAFVAIQPNQPGAVYYKNHLFQLMQEDKYLSPGNQAETFDSIIGKSGAGICFDLRFPEFFKELLVQGAGCFLIAAHWPYSRITHWDILLQARAIENQSFIIAVNSVGKSGGDIYGGHSVVISPNGEILLRAPSNEEGIYVVEINLQLITQTRNNFKIIKKTNDPV